MDHQINAETLRKYLPKEENQQGIVLRTPKQESAGKDYSHEIGILYNMVMQNKKELEELKQLLNGAQQPEIPTAITISEPEQPASITISQPETTARKHIEAEDIDGSSLRVDESEKELIRRALELCNGNRKEAAARLGFSERTLYRKIKEYGL